MSCPHGNPHEYCDICDEINAAYDRGYADGLAEQEPIPFGQPGSREGFPPLEPLETLAYPLKECRHCGWLCTPNSGQSKKFYPLPQEREWVDLTDDEILEAVGIRYAEPHTKHRILKDARAVIAAFKEKNK